MSLVNCAILPEIEMMVQANFDSRIKTDFTPRSESAKAIIENSTASFAELEGVKDREIKINWLTYCDAAVQDCTDDCVNEPVAQIAAHCENYSLSQCKETEGFFVDEKDLRDKRYETQELIALGLTKDAKVLDEYISMQAVAAVNAFAGVNAYDNPGWTVNGTQTEIPAAQWSPSMVAQLAMTAELNQFSDAYLLSGQNLYIANWNANLDATNPDGPAMKNRANYFKTYFDLFKLDNYNSGVRKTYMIQKGALAFASKSYYKSYTSANPFKGPNDVLIWSMPSPSLTGVTYDVHYKYTCVNNKYIHSFKLKTKFDFFENPLGCDPTNTGIITFVCV